MDQEIFDRQFEDERSELAYYEYSQPLESLTIEDEEDTDNDLLVCTCHLNPDYCELHNDDDEPKEIHY